MEHNYFLAKNADWRKKAAMTAVNDLDIEKAFADQASGFVENKLEPLMKAPYNIGFEVVRKNDDNTRLIGIFAFKVDDHLLFAPVFFLNGEIKGPLLYRCDTKTFVPANKDWATYLISSLESEEGKGIPRSRRGESAPLVQMQRINFMPNGTTKSASVVSEGNKPSCTCTPIPTPEGNCTVVISVAPEYSSSKTWNNRLPGGESLLKMAAADDGTIRCEFEGEKFMLSAEDGKALACAENSSSIRTPEGVLLKLASVETQRVKTAFFVNVPDRTAQWEEAMMQGIVANSKPGVLRDFLKEADYGKPAAEALVKAASDHTFAEALAECYNKPEDLFPTEYTTTKKTAKDEGSLTIQYTLEALPKEDRIRSEFFRDGFYILDSRPQETMSVVTEEAPSGITAITEPGVYSVLREDGKFEEDVFVAPYGNSLPLPPYSSYAKSGIRHAWDCDVNKGITNLSAIAVKDGAAYYSHKAMMGCKTGSVNRYAGIADSLTKHSTYMLFLKDVAYGPFVVMDLDTADGVQYVKVSRSTHTASDGSLGCYAEAHTPGKLTFNKDVAVTNWEKGVVGADAVLIKLNAAPVHTDWNRTDYSVWKNGGSLDVPLLEHIGSIDNLDDFIYSTWKLPTVKIMKEVTKEAGYRFSDGKSVSGRMNRCEALVKLARDMAISAPQAYDLLQKADTAGQHKFYLEPGEKVAMRLRVVDRPNFDDEFDSEFGMPLQRTKEYRLRIQGEQMFEPSPAIGDMMNPTTVSGLPDATVVSAKPEDLRVLADTYKLPHVFEHSVVGTLADTFDAIALVDKYLPRIEDAVDALYRTLFLLYWRTSDFEKVYGIDDIPNFEAETLANGESLGAMFLRQLKKTDAYKKGASERNKQEQGQR